LLSHNYFVGVSATVLKSALHLAPVQTSVFTLHSSTKYYEKTKNL